MADSYLSIAAIANDDDMRQRMYAAVTQQQTLGNFKTGLTNVRPPFSAQEWVDQYKYVWAASPDWGAAWDSALAGGNEAPGKDAAVITDGMILATVQQLGGQQEAEAESEQTPAS